MTWTPYSAQPIRNRETVRFRPAAGHGRNGAPYTVDGRFTKEERAYLIPLDAVDEVRTGSSVCSERLREECMRRCHEGRKPRRGRGPSGRAGRPRWQRGPFWTHMAGPGAWPSRRHPNRPREPGIRQSMSRRACCRDNACIGSFWGRMEEQMGDAAHLPPGGHGACRQARRLLQRSQGAGASGMADPHGACRKVHCLAVCGDWCPPQQQDPAFCA